MATCEQPIYVGNIGTTFRCTITECVNGADQAVNVGAATTLQLIFEKPDGTSTTKTAILSTDGSDGKIEYTTVSGDLDQAGVWRIQAKVIIAGNEYFSSIASFEVESTL